jgi:peptide deformylase
VGVGRRIAVVDLTVGEDPAKLLVLINPRILEVSGSYVDEEGCLSLPGFSERVRRPERCVIEAMDLDGRIRTLDGRELLARAFNHEIDHLHGRLFIEHLSVLKRRLIKKKVQKRMREGDWQLVPA